ncbi:hypothetical protein MKX01_019759 [Papaver californicum]|nr:hypothetical protein MKX01_019759 [Papaver californicum]
MALTNFVITVAGVGAVVLLLRSDIKQSASLVRRDIRHIRNWLEKESIVASKYKAKVKELESQVPLKNIPKEISTKVFHWRNCISDVNNICQKEDFH